jgi:hypothetical protein
VLCSDKKTYHEIVDEIYNEGKNWSSISSIRMPVCLTKSQFIYFIVYTLGKDPEHVCPNLHISTASRDPFLLITLPSFHISPFALIYRSIHEGNSRFDSVLPSFQAVDTEIDSQASGRLD